jgi:hypothetical protein
LQSSPPSSWVESVTFFGWTQKDLDDASKVYNCRHSVTQCRNTPWYISARNRVSWNWECSRMRGTAWTLWRNIDWLSTGSKSSRRWKSGIVNEQPWKSVIRSRVGGASPATREEARPVQDSLAGNFSVDWQKASSPHFLHLSSGPFICSVQVTEHCCSEMAKVNVGQSLLPPDNCGPFLISYWLPGGSRRVGHSQEILDSEVKSSGGFVRYVRRYYLISAIRLKRTGATTTVRERFWLRLNIHKSVPDWKAESQ